MASHDGCMRAIKALRFSMSADATLPLQVCRSPPSIKYKMEEKHLHTSCRFASPSCRLRVARAIHLSSTNLGHIPLTTFGLQTKRSRVALGCEMGPTSDPPPFPPDIFPQYNVFLSLQLSSMNAGGARRISAGHYGLHATYHSEPALQQVHNATSLPSASLTPFSRTMCLPLPESAPSRSEAQHVVFRP